MSTVDMNTRKDFLRKGLRARSVGNLRSARKWFEKCAHGHPYRRGAVGGWRLAADVATQLGDDPGALEYLRKARQRDPKSAPAFMQAGIIHREQNRLKLAERMFRKSLEIDPNATGFIFLGDVLNCRMQREEATDAFRAALKLEPNNEEAHFNLGLNYKFANEPVTAEKHFRRAINNDPKYALALAELGFILIGKGELKEARRLLAKSVRIDPENFWSRLYLANVYWQSRQLTRAEEQYRSAVQLQPEDATVLAMLGDFLSCNGKRGAKQHLTKALKLNPRDALANYYMGKHELRAGHEGIAMKHLRISKRAGHKRAGQLLERLL